MKAFSFVLTAALALSTSSCGPLTSIACDRAAVLCGDVDVDACDDMLDYVPPRTRSDIVGCTSAARSCGEATACFTHNQLALPTYD